MRAVFVLLLMIAVAIGGAWLVGEPWLAEQARTAIDRSPVTRVASVAPLRRPDRIGVRLEELEYDTAIGGLPAGVDLPRLDLWVAPYWPLRLRLDPHDGIGITRPGGRHILTMTSAAGDLSLSPLRGMALAGAGIRAEAVDLDGRQVLRGLDLRLDDVDDDRVRGAAYDLDMTLEALEMDRLAALDVPPLALPGSLAVAGTARLWLERAPSPRTLSEDAPRLIGLRSDQGVTIRLGDLGVRLLGHLVADDQGRAEGIVAVYSRDFPRIIDAAVSAGIVSGDGSMLVAAILGNLGRMPIPEEPGQPGFPEPAEGELRLPVVMAGGRLSVGNIPIGVAPRLRDLAD